MTCCCPRWSVAPSDDWREWFQALADNGRAMLVAPATSAARRRGTIAAVVRDRAP